MGLAKGNGTGVTAGMKFGRQEDAHEFLSRLLTVSFEHFVDRAGGPAALGLRDQETTIFHHLFGCYALNQLECLVRTPRPLHAPSTERCVLWLQRMHAQSIDCYCECHARMPD